MRSLHLVLLTILLCSDHAPALSQRCYVCIGLESSNQCQVAHCAEGPNVCYKGNIIITFVDGQKIKSKHGGCAPSCDAASHSMQQMANPVGRPDLAPKSEVQGFSCCATDLCNGVAQVGRSLWVLAGGLLLSLGSALLWALL